MKPSANGYLDLNPFAGVKHPNDASISQTLLKSVVENLLAGNQSLELV